MYRSLVIISLVYLCGLIFVEGIHKKFGCLLSPSICTPPEDCSNDGLFGNCEVPYTRLNRRPVNDEAPFVDILRNLEKRGYALDYRTIRDALYESYYDTPDYRIDSDVIGLAKLLSELENANFRSLASATRSGREYNDPALEAVLADKNPQEYRRSAPRSDDDVLQSNQRKQAMMQLVNETRDVLKKSDIKLSDLSESDIEELASILAQKLISDEKSKIKNASDGKAENPQNKRVSMNGEKQPQSEQISDSEVQNVLSASDSVEETMSLEKPAEPPHSKKDSFAERSPLNSDFEASEPQHKPHNGNKTLYVVIIVVGVTVLLIILVTIITCCVRVYWDKKGGDKVISGISAESSHPLNDDYQELCRQHYASKSSEQTENRAVLADPDTVKEPLITRTYPVSRPNDRDATADGHIQDQKHAKTALDATRNSSVSSTSWSEEPVTASLDITTGHAVLSYMEDHLNNKDRLDEEWEEICSYEADRTATNVATNPQNSRKNRAVAALPYDHNRVKLEPKQNHLQSDYINASRVIDNDPKRPLYIATQGPLASTIPDFWQMMWEQGCVAIVMLTPLVEEGVNQCARYWPDEGSCTYHKFEIHLVSEHIWCEDYLVRSLYLKNLETGDTRTVTQFHFLSWPNNRIPPSPKPLLELRRKVTKCYKGHNSPVLVHCSDGIGRSGTYILLDLAIDRMLKGAKEIDISATLEHIRDQRAGMVSTKEQFEFALTAVAEEVNAILKSLLH